MKSELARGFARFGWVLVLAGMGCGDAESTDKRGYTKAPLEHAGVLIRPEKPTVMDELGTPILPVAEVIEVADTAAKK